MNGFTLFLEADDSRAENNTKRKLILFPEEKQDSDFHFREDPLLVLHILERTIQRRYDLIAICNVSGWWPCVPDATLLIVVGQSRWTGGEGEPRRLMKPRSLLLLREDPADLNIKRLRRGCKKNPRDTTGRPCFGRQSMTSDVVPSQGPDSGSDTRRFPSCCCCLFGDMSA